MKIKYDKKSFQLYICATIWAAIIFAIGIFIIMRGTRNLQLEGLCIFLLYVGGITFLICLSNAVEAYFYFRRLKRYGYEVPYRKKDFGNDLQNLPRNMEISETSIYCKYNKMGAIASLIAFGIFLALDILYFVEWHFMKDDCNALFVMILILNSIFWLPFGFIMIKQSNPEKYRDDVELDRNRKVRNNAITILVKLIIFSVICTFANNSAHSMTRYIFETRVHYDKEEMDKIRYAMNEAMSELDSETLEACPSYTELLDGVDIVQWGKPEDAFQTAVAEKLQITSFEEYRDEFRMSEDAGVYVELKSGKLTLTLLNTIKETSKSRGAVDGKIQI